jgi:hypothetical protein
MKPSWFFLAAVVFVAVNARAQTVPQPAQSVGARVGFVSLGPPAVVVDVALRESGPFLPMLTAWTEVHTASVGIGGGASLLQRLSPWVSVREFAHIAPFVSWVDGATVGVRTTVSAQLAFDVTDHLLFAVGPEVVPVVSLAAARDRSSDGRLGVSLVGAARWFFARDLAATLSLSGGYDAGGKGAGALSSSAFLGMLADW